LRRTVGDAADRIVLEEKIEGREVSLMALVDGERVLPLEPACDYKRAFDGDRGPNTGGMGGYSPVPSFGVDAVPRAVDTVLAPGSAWCWPPAAIPAPTRPVLRSMGWGRSSAMSSCSTPGPRQVRPDTSPPAAAC